MNLSYMTAKVTGFGGTLDYTDEEEQDVSCTLKEAMMTVVFYKIYP